MAVLPRLTNETPKWTPDIKSKTIIVVYLGFVKILILANVLT